MRKAKILPDGPIVNVLRWLYDQQAQLTFALVEKPDGMLCEVSHDDLQLQKKEKII